MQETKECIYGDKSRRHHFEPRFDSEQEDFKEDKVSGNTFKKTYRRYLYDICTNCGMIVRRIYDDDLNAKK